MSNNNLFIYFFATLRCDWVGLPWRWGGGRSQNKILRFLINLKLLSRLKFLYILMTNAPQNNYLKKGAAVNKFGYVLKKLISSWYISWHFSSIKKQRILTFYFSFEQPFQHPHKYMSTHFLRLTTTEMRLVLRSLLKIIS